MENLNLILYILIHIVAIKMNLFVEYLEGIFLIVSALCQLIALIIVIKAKTKNN